MSVNPIFRRRSASPSLLSKRDRSDARAHLVKISLEFDGELWFNCLRGTGPLFVAENVAPAGAGAAAPTVVGAVASANTGVKSVSRAGIAAKSRFGGDGVRGR